MEMLDSLPTLLKSFWYIAIPTSIIFIIQTIITFSGLDIADGVDTDFHGDTHAGGDFQLFSLRNLINFLLGFSWTGISFYTTIGDKPIFLIITSLVVGVLFVILFFLVIRQVQKLAEDNSFKITNTLHKTAEVYLTIPENKKGKGKIMISVNGAFHELEAMTEQERIPSGAIVKVIKIENNNILIVESI